MALTINTNIASLQSQEYLRISTEFQQKTINRVTSGLRIISSGDDAAGLSIANGFRSDRAVLMQGVRNANDGLSTLQTIDGGVNNISQLLDRARTLATQSASGTFAGSREVLDSEFQSVISEIDRQAQAIGLNINGIFAKSMSVFIGGGRDSGSITGITNGSVGVDLTESTVDATSLGLKSVQAANTGYDLGPNSATSISKILENSQNTSTEAVNGHTRFVFRGAGFSDANAVTIDVNVGGVTDTNTLLAAINQAIEVEEAKTGANYVAFKEADISAKMVTDANGRQQLAFSAPSAAFQVAGNDRVANALLGNFADAPTGLGAAANSVTGITPAVPSGTTAAGATLTFTGNVAASNGTIAVTTTADMTAQEFVDAFNAGTPGGGMTANVYRASLDSAGRVVISSIDGSSFSVAADATNGDLFLAGGPTASSFNLNSLENTGGVQSSKQFADSQAFTFASPLNLDQTVTFAGTHADGTPYSWSTLLDGDATALTIDTAVSALNTALQGSNDPSLQKIVAVKDVDSTGTALGIRFMSSDAFTVSFTSVAGGLGLKDGSTGAVPQGAILASEESTGGGRVAIATQIDAEAAVTTLAEAVAKLGAAQAVVGKGQNQFSFAISLASTQLTNLAASESRIRDADLAAEAANLTKAQILQQAGIAAMAQANSAPQVVLSLLQG